MQQEPTDKPAELVEALAVGPVKSVVVLADGQQSIVAALKPRLIQLLWCGLLPAAREAQALCVLRSGFGRLLGSALADSGQGIQVLGVAPRRAPNIGLQPHPRSSATSAVPPESVAGGAATEVLDRLQYGRYREVEA